MFKVLDECSATARKSIEGLDNFVMEGSRGFGELEAMLNPLANQDEEVRLLKERLQEGKRYLKSKYKVEESITAIRKWKAHTARSKCQERAKAVLVQNMTVEDIIISCDWAMKFLPRKYREGMVDLFAKRGTYWHVAVCLMKHEDAYRLLLELGGSLQALQLHWG